MAFDAEQFGYLLTGVGAAFGILKSIPHLRRVATALRTRFALVSERDAAIGLMHAAKAESASNREAANGWESAFHALETRVTDHQHSLDLLKPRLSASLKFARDMIVHVQRLETTLRAHNIAIDYTTPPIPPELLEELD